MFHDKVEGGQVVPRNEKGQTQHHNEKRSTQRQLCIIRELWVVIAPQSLGDGIAAASCRLLQ